MRDHGGDLDRIRAQKGGEDWIDLSTGINRVPWPVPAVSAQAWTALPTAGARHALLAAAAQAYGTSAPMVALAGAQAAIQMLPLALGRVETVRILSPTYNEHAACFAAAGWQVEAVRDPEALVGAPVALVVNPNNPDGRALSPDALLALRGQVGHLVVDESFVDPVPHLSVSAQAGEGLTVLRSFGKFYGLAGMRLGFAIGDAPLIARLEAMAGPWPVSGPALEIGATALRDAAWAQASAARLAQDAARLDGLAGRFGWALVGGTPLFRLYDTQDAGGAQDHLADHRIWSRIFPWSPRLIRLGLPGKESEWERIAAALDIGTD